MATLRTYFRLMVVHATVAMARRARVSALVCERSSALAVAVAVAHAMAALATEVRVMEVLAMEIVVMEIVAGATIEIVMAEMIDTNDMAVA
jgi:hypothetical protein